MKGARYEGHTRTGAGSAAAARRGHLQARLESLRLDRALLWCANGCSQQELHDAVRRLVGGTWTPPKQADMWTEAEVRRRKQEQALRLWKGSEPAIGTPVQAYGIARGLPDLAHSAALRFRLDCPHPDGGKLPAMLALVVDAAGVPIGVHRTYLRRDGAGKADVTPAKASLGPVWGGAIRLDPLAPELVVGEGIESAASAGRLLALPAWSALSAGNLARGQHPGPGHHPVPAQLLGEPGQRGQVLLQFGRGHERPAVPPHGPRDQAPAAQLGQRVPQRHPADPEPRGQFLLGRQPVAGRQRAGGDLAGQPVLDLPVHGGARLAHDPRRPPGSSPRDSHAGQAVIPPAVRRPQRATPPAGTSCAARPPGSRPPRSAR